MNSSKSHTGAELFQSFILGGFECATHLRRDGHRIDVIHSTHHDLRAGEDYDLLRQAGITTVRDGLRWHLIETSPGVYDWSSFLPMLQATVASGTQVIWDLCHWGVPAWLDVFSADFVRLFADYARAAAQLVATHSDSVPFFCPINEISFWAWVGGDEAHFGPHARGRGPELKRQLVRASIAAMHAVRAVDPRARFVQAEPIIHVDWNRGHPDDRAKAERHSRLQYEAWDLLCGRADELQATGVGGSPEMLDIIGVNFYWNNEWVHNGERTPPGHWQHVPLHVMLRELWERYRRPILISETGAEGTAGFGWLGYISAEVRQAQREGVDVQGICLYPVMDYLGWDDDRHCQSGLIALSDDLQERSLREDLVAEIRSQMVLFEESEERLPALAR